MHTFVQGELAAFFQLLKKFLQTVPSFRDTKGKHKEQFFHGLLLGMTISVSNTYTVTSSRTSPIGEYDIALTPKNHHHKGWIIELKVTKKLDKLKEKAKEGHAQAIKKKYATDMRASGVKEIGYMGIAFCGNEVALVSNKDTFSSIKTNSFDTA
ncbi:MAG: PD-(D/E)XK nuclease domain-containing protein [Bacteroidota bacterium]